MTEISLAFNDVAHQLIAYEKGSKSAAMNVLEKLRLQISALAGEVGFRSLLDGALVRARLQCPCLRGIQVGPEGALRDLSELPVGEAEEAGTVLVTELLALLSTTIGETLTLRLLHKNWPHLISNDRSQHDPAR